MGVNNSLIKSSARHVSGRCRLNGTDVPFVSFSIESNAFRGADTFDLTLAVSALPAAMQMLNWWAVQTTIRVELFVSITTQAGVDERKHITGNIDTWHYEPARFEIQATGRDFTARLIDARTTGESFKNYTSSQIARMLAKRHNLKPVITATTQRVGEYFQIDTAHLTGEQTDWDLITTLAAIENFAVFVRDDSLHFEPKRASAEVDSYVIRWQPPGVHAYPQCNVSCDLSFSRALTITRGVTVEVMSWNSKLKNKKFMVSYPTMAKGVVPGKATAETQVYRIIRNGLTPDAANMLARSLYQQIVQHEMTFSGSTAGDNLLNADMPVRIEGTRSPFDQVYRCDQVRRTLSWVAGYTMQLSGRNHSPTLDVVQ